MHIVLTFVSIIKLIYISYIIHKLDYLKHAYRTKEFDMPKVAGTIIHFRRTTSVRTVAGLASNLEIICAHSRISHAAVHGQSVPVSLYLCNSCPYFFIVAKLYFLRDGPLFLITGKSMENLNR